MLRLLPRTRIRFGIVLAALLVTACTTRHSWQARVPLTGPVGAVCLEAALDAEEDVVHLQRLGDGGLEFVIRLPDVDESDWPAYTLDESDGSVTEPAGKGQGRSLSLSTGYATGPFSFGASGRAREGIDRAAELIIAVAEACTGRRPTLGPAQPCGKGEANDLCVEGRFQSGG